MPITSLRHSFFDKLMMSFVCLNFLVASVVISFVLLAHGLSKFDTFHLESFLRGISATCIILTTGSSSR